MEGLDYVDGAISQSDQPPGRREETTQRGREREREGEGEEEKEDRRKMRIPKRKKKKTESERASERKTQAEAIRGGMANDGGGWRCPTTAKAAKLWVQEQSYRPRVCSVYYYPDIYLFQSVIQRQQTYREYRI